ncbi:peptidase domain-containing ABC transporter [Piscinibacter sakaiensis]|uniref:peptidase domain-containing ABC transporter n=1 Tax=Piscinibacter sakaiensis TaxID=1547922 RepID=UPI003AABEDA8
MSELLGRVNFGFGSRLPVVLQTEASECGLACMAMISGFHRGNADLASLRRSFGLSIKGVRLSDLTRIADLMGFATRPLRLELDELDQLQLPCILHWDLNHFVVLREVHLNDIVIHDPAIGVRRIPMRAVSEHFSGVALELTPTHTFRPKAAPPRLRLIDAIGPIVGLRSALGKLFAMALALEAFFLLQPFFIQLVVDNALVSADRDLLLTLAIAFAFLMLLQVSFTAMRGWMVMVLGASLKVQGSGSLFTHLQKLPSAFFEARHLGDIVSRFGSMETIQRALTLSLVEALLDGLFAIATLAIMYLLSPMLATMVLLAAVLYGLIRWAFYTPLREASLETIVWDARADSHFLESMRAIRTIKLMVGQNSRRAQWLNLLVETVNRDLVAQKLRLLFRAANGLLIGSLMILVVWRASVLVLDNVFSVGMMLAFLAYQGQFVSRISALIDTVVDLRMLRLHSERLADIVLTPPEDTSARRDASTLEPSIELRGLRFRYGEQEPWVLDGIDLRIEPQESVAIVGASGCGKTTLLKILSSLLQPTSGEVLIGGEPLTHIGADAYRSIIGVVMQDDQLLAGSIADNICFFSDRPDRERIIACARMAAIDGDIRAMPMGYETLIGDMGSSVSGGQKQRILLARALYLQPRILLLDEATSHLDVALERQVNEALSQMPITRIVIAHRPETIRSAERIITLENGRIVGDSRRSPADEPGPQRLEGQAMAALAPISVDGDGGPGWQDTQP